MPPMLDRRTALAGAGAIVTAQALPSTAQAQATPPVAAAAGQAPGFYRFKVGSFTVTMLHDGFVRRPVENFIVNAPLPDVQQVLAESLLPPDLLTIPFTLTCIDTGRDLVLFDTGTAAFAPTTGQLGANMRAAGIDPARIGTVAISHFHGDHINGLLADTAAAFPRAEIVVPDVEHAWWTDAGNETRSPAGQRANFANTARRFGPYDASRVRKVADGAEIVPGIRSVAARGHTPGHTVLHVADGADQLIFIADTAGRPELFVRRPGLHAVFDFDPAMAEVTRRRLLDRVSADRIRISGYHFPFPSNGHVARDGANYRFLPADWSGIA